jgi:hypothetical protein
MGVSETFWHELVHAILWDQGYFKLCKDERFVARFAAALNKTIASAKFDEDFDVEKWKRENL